MNRKTYLRSFDALAIDHAPATVSEYCTKRYLMSEALTELLFWIVVFVVFFYGFRWLQKRKKAKDTQDRDGGET